MELGTRDTLLTALAAAALLVGTILILVQHSLATIAGILLIIAGTIVFIVDLKDIVVKTDENTRK